MMGRMILDRLEDVLLEADEELTNEAYEKFISGELTIEQLETVYCGIRTWSEILMQREQNDD